jgi:fermentation-respiration switch protein FrsA (DUF1100 family)
MKKTTKNILKTSAIVGSAVGTVYLTIGSFLYYFTLTEMGLRTPFIAKIASGKPKKVDEERVRVDNLKKDGMKWFDEIPKESLVTKSTNFNKILHANLILPEEVSNVFVFVIHGYTSNPRGMGVYVKHYHEMGYNVLTPSLNGHAESESSLITMGWKDRLDVIDWINFIVENYPDCKIVLHGESMGSATTMMATGENLPDNVKVAVADCGYTSVWDIFDNKIRNNFKMPTFPFLNSMNTVNKVCSGFDFRKASSVEQLKKSKTPTIFIHGDKDTFVPYEMLEKVYEACASEKEKVTIAGSPHARNSVVNPELYWSSVDKFISKYL